MTQNTQDSLLRIAIVGLASGGFVLLFFSIFFRGQTNWELPAALACIMLSNLFNVIRTQNRKKHGND